MKPIFICFAGVIASSQAATVSVPFSTDFDSYTAGTNISALFVESNGGGTPGNSEFISLGGTNIALRQTISSTAVSGTSNTAASVSHANADFVAAGGFLVSTTFTINSSTVGSGGVVNVSLNALSNATDLSSGYRLIYTLSGSPSGSLTIQQAGTGAALTTTNNPPASSVISPGSGTITLTLRGLYDGTTLNLFGTITDGTTTYSASAVDTAGSPGGNVLATGDNFGVRSALANSTTGTSPAIDSNETVTFTSFSLQAIPEPSSLMMFSAAAGLIALRRKRA